ncbi:hypothetical protein [Pediococcus claussenii]|uniref:Monooxygenase n=1 Tax=Pediococcus claussenii (strain ATCC BAA-344 / DSM 14800 / JCM 18046 / KCTC 3811 / LMG 21948 / P06) TaxID=701521 RepID=G8PCR9_PEDCP|nr:hypothetical protein [Pediococcus claussenii]AEV95054.1 hypothetical protein PECL_780 [Pediococcus claussenii ATCC BAA-344]ANZ70242.1 hypothetical protein AYR57_07920 [Pediococcus claussenii]ANZ72058.1 hypothetical protein AYR58_07920 [Pediococcus claussenii]
MITQLSTTFGSWNILNQIKKNNPSREMVVLSGTSSQTDLQLVDVSGKDSVFQTPIDYSVINQYGESSWRGFFRFAFFNLPDEELRVFDSKVNHLMSAPEAPVGLQRLLVLEPKKHKNERVLLTIWQLDSDYSLWKRSASYTPFKTYTNGTYQFRDTNYTAYDLN